MSVGHLTSTPDSRAAMIEQAFRLEYITLAWMVVRRAVGLIRNDDDR